MSLFPLKKKEIKLKPGKLFYSSNFLPTAEADQLFAYLKDTVPWSQEKIKLFGKEHLIPRLQAWYGDANAQYGYSGIQLTPVPFEGELQQLKSKIEEHAETTFNSCLINLYRDGNDSMGWHSDDEKELGEDPIIASLSLGAIRRFDLKHKVEDRPQVQLELEHGSLVIMHHGVQDNWKHRIAKRKSISQGRINLTFRSVRI